MTLGYRGGKQRRKSIYGKTRQEVAQKLSKALIDKRQGSIVADERLTLAAFLDSWLYGTAKSRLRRSTFVRYETLLRLHVLPSLGRIPVNKLSPQDVQHLIKDLLAAGLAPRTVIQVRAILRTALNQAVRHSLAQKNSAALSDAPKVPAFKPAYLDAVQAERLLAACKGHSLEAFVTLALTSGLRVGELLGLSWGDIDFDNRTLTVKRQQLRVGKEVIVCEPKTERSARTIPLTQMAIDALLNLKEWQISEHRADLEKRVLSGRVFTNENGALLQSGTVLRQFQRLVAQAGLPKMRLHDLRHSCATLLLAKAVHPRVVMEILGHSTIAMTMNVYSHVVPEIVRDAADAMDSVFSPKTAVNERN